MKYNDKFVGEVMKHNEEQGREIQNLNIEINAQRYTIDLLNDIIEEQRKTIYGLEEGDADFRMAAENVIDTQSDMIDELNSRIEELEQENEILQCVVDDMINKNVEIALKNRRILV